MPIAFIVTQGKGARRQLWVTASHAEAWRIFLALRGEKFIEAIRPE